MIRPGMGIHRVVYCTTRAITVSRQRGAIAEIAPRWRVAPAPAVVWPDAASTPPPAPLVGDADAMPCRWVNL